MKIFVFSDSHGRGTLIVKAIRREAPDFVFFLGDGENDLKALRQAFPALPFEAVRGNCDFRSQLPAELVCSVGGVRFFITHGHRYDVKTERTLESLKRAARQAGAQVVLFGHTHEPYLEEEKGLILLNPGAAGSYGNPGYGVLELTDGQILARLETL